MFRLSLAIYLAVAAWLVWRCAVLQPYSDMFDWVAHWYAYRQDGDLGRYLLTPTNSHRIAWTFALLDADVRLAGASGYLFPIAGALCLGATAILLARQATRAAPTLGLAAGGLAAILTLMPAASLDAAIPINGDYLHCLVFAVLAIVLGLGVEKPRLGRWLGALAAAAASAFGIGVGLAVWPVLIFGAWRGKAGWPAIALVGISGFLFIGLYVSGQAMPTGGGGGILSALQLALSVLGLPWTRALPGAGWLLGLALLAAGVVALVRRGGPGSPAPERLAVGLILFSLITAAMAAIGRTGLTDPLAPPLRYAVFVTPLHVGLLILALPWLETRRAAWPRRFDATLAAVGLTALAQVGVMGREVIRTTDTNRQMIADFRSGTASPAMAATVHPNLAAARIISDKMRHDGIYQHELHLVR